MESAVRRARGQPVAAAADLAPTRGGEAEAQAGGGRSHPGCAGLEGHHRKKLVTPTALMGSASCRGPSPDDLCPLAAVRLWASGSPSHDHALCTADTPGRASRAGAVVRI